MFCSSEFMYQMPGDFQPYDISSAAEGTGYQHNTTTTNVLSHYQQQQQQQQQNDMAIYNNDRPSPSFRIDDILVQKGHPYATMYSNSGHFGQYGGGFHPDKDYQEVNTLVSNMATPFPAYFRLKPNMRTSSGRKCRKPRTVFSELQLMVLEREFKERKYLSTPQRTKLAERLGLNQTQVKTWYQNRRMKWKKETNESDTKKLKQMNVPSDDDDAEIGVEDSSNDVTQHLQHPPQHPQQHPPQHPQHNQQHTQHNQQQHLPHTQHNPSQQQQCHMPQQQLFPHPQTHNVLDTTFLMTQSVASVI